MLSFQLEFELLPFSLIMIWYFFSFEYVILTQDDIVKYGFAPAQINLITNDVHDLNFMITILIKLF